MDLSYNNISHYIAESIKQLLRRNMVIASVLENNTKLTSIDLSNNNINDAGAQLFSKLLKKTVLDLDGSFQ